MSSDEPIEGKLIERKKQRVTRKVFGKEIFATTKEEETEVSPKPSEFTRESESSISGGIGTSQLGIQASYTEKDRRKLEFEERKSKSSKNLPRESIPRGLIMSEY